MGGETAVITTVFAPDGESGETALRCMAATRAEFSGCRRIAAVDSCGGGLLRALRAARWEIVQLSSGRPPRMTRLIEAALAACAEAKIVWTIEMDASIHRGAREIAEGALGIDAEIGGVECNAVNARGRLTEPTHMRVLRCGRYEQYGRLRLCPALSFNCTAWRGAALRQVDWRKAPVLVKADTAVSKQLTARGWRLLIATTARVTHFRRTSRKAEIRLRHATDARR